MAQNAAAKRRKAQPEDYPDIDIARMLDDPLLQAVGALVEHRQPAALLDERRGDLLAVAPPRQQVVDRVVDPVGLAGGVAIKPLVILATFSPVGGNRFERGRRVPALRERLLQRLGGFKCDVHADLVDQLHRANREAPLGHGLVDRVDGRAFLEDPARLVDIGTDDPAGEKPGPSLTTMQVLPIFRPTSSAVATALLEVLGWRMISSSGILCTGLKKCMPSKFSGRLDALASSVIGMVEVLLATMAVSLRCASRSWMICCFSSRSSKTASITSWAWAKPV